MPNSSTAFEPRLREILDTLIREGNFQLSYRFLQPAAGVASIPGMPETVVDFEGSDAALLLAEEGELLRSFEHLAFEALRWGQDEHDHLLFDCHHRRMLRIQELYTVARMAAEQVMKTGRRYEFAPMSSRERRLIHLALHDLEGVVSQSEGLGPMRHVVIQSAKDSGRPGAIGVRRR